MKELPLGIRLNNPGLLVHTGENWLGLAAKQWHDRFMAFVEPKYGIRAMARNLHTWFGKHGPMTLRQIIERWAPPHENDTSAYIESVHIRSGIGRDETVDVFDYDTMFALLRSIVRHECGDGREWDRPEDWFDEVVYEQGLRLAGVTRSKPLSQSRTTKGVAVGTGASVVAIGVLTDTLGLPPDVAALLPGALAGLSDQTVAAIAVGVAVAAKLFAAWARWDDKVMGRL